MSFSKSHQYLDNDPSGTPSDSYTIMVTVTDDDTGSLLATTSIQVDNVVSTVNAGPDETIDDGTFSRSGSFTDPGILDTWTATRHLDGLHSVASRLI